MFLTFLYPFPLTMEASSNPSVYLSIFLSQQITALKLGFRINIFVALVLESLKLALQGCSSLRSVSFIGNSVVKFVRFCVEDFFNRFLNFLKQPRTIEIRMVATALWAGIPAAWVATTPEQRNKLVRCLFQQVWLKDKEVVAVKPLPELEPFFRMNYEDFLKNIQDKGSTRVELHLKHDFCAWLIGLKITIERTGGSLFRCRYSYVEGRGYSAGATAHDDYIGLLAYINIPGFFPDCFLRTRSYSHISLLITIYPVNPLRQPVELAAAGVYLNTSISNAVYLRAFGSSQASLTSIAVNEYVFLPGLCTPFPRKAIFVCSM